MIGVFLFQSTPPQGGRRLQHRVTGSQCSFNPHPQRWGRPADLAAHHSFFANFNPRPMLGRQMAENNVRFNLKFQSTPCKRVTRISKHYHCPIPISIHALTREATYLNRCSASSHPISIHVPVRGTTCYRGVVPCGWHISIHAPTRGATLLVPRLRQRIEISIHAPTRGATPPQRWGPEPTYNFNPRPHAGGDTGLQRHCTRANHFNPRPHAGGDVPHMTFHQLRHIFQSTPPRRGRRISGCGNHSRTSQ